MSEPGTDDVPDRRPNILRDRLEAAATTAGGSRLAIGAVYGNPLDAVAGRIERAWVADGSTVRQNFVDDVRGAGLGVRGAFDGQHDRLQADAESEPPEIDVNARPDLKWKTDGGRIDSRASMARHY
ncbi:hypothetical protein [uncultured Cellulomonas sp.]|uniref:hypothetical protein n=1 Tax=uncultured Cellulomonas sp. TaxID=189682 RepID=UPI0028ED88FE|nr:hypothetical protein [uncultured Cellulomonas sp.]